MGNILNPPEHYTTLYYTPPKALTYNPKTLHQHVVANICSLEPMPVFELVPELEPVHELEVAPWSETELEPVPVLELVLGVE